MKYSEYKINDTIEIGGQKYTLLEDRIVKGKQKKKTLGNITIFSVVSMVILYIIQGYLITLIWGDRCFNLGFERTLILFAAFFVIFITFIIIHELLHYAVYRFIGGTDKKDLKFGVILKQGMAYCISLVPNSVKASRLSLMMPIYALIIPLGIIAVATGSEYLSILNAAFFSGSAGDIWYMWTLRKTDKNLYMIEEEPEGKDYQIGYYLLEKQD